MQCLKKHSEPYKIKIHIHSDTYLPINIQCVDFDMNISNYQMVASLYY